MYESWFGFTKRPFVAAPQADSYYPAEVNESALQALIWCVERGAGPGVVIGATGTGKTTLALMIRQYFKSMMPVALISGGTCKDSRALLQNMLYAFSLPYEDSDEGQLRLSLTEFFNSRAEGRGSLLIVDEADKLDETKLEEIRTFADLTGENGYAVHVVLVGSPRLEERLAMPSLAALNQRVATRCYLATWNGEETRNYILRQFERAGAAETSPFDDSAIEQIAHCTDGVPRLVNQLCDHALMLAAAAGVHNMSAPGITEAWADLQNLPAPVQASTTEYLDTMDESILEFGTLDGDETTVENASETVYESVSATAENNEAIFQPDLSDFEPVVADEFAGSAGSGHDAEEEAAGPLMEPVNFEAPEDEAYVTHTGSETSMLEALNAIAVSEEFPKSHQPELAEEEQPMVAETPSTNPFLEEFETEEIVIGRVIRICDESSVLTQNVRTEEGQALSDVLNLIDMTRESTKPRFHETISDQVESQNQLAVGAREVTSSESPTPEFEPSAGESNAIEMTDRVSTETMTVAECDQAPATYEYEVSHSAVAIEEPGLDDHCDPETANVEAEPLQDVAPTAARNVEEVVSQEPRRKSKRFGQLFTRLSRQ